MESWRIEENEEQPMWAVPLYRLHREPAASPVRLTGCEQVPVLWGMLLENMKELILCCPSNGLATPSLNGLSLVQARGMLEYDEIWKLMQTIHPVPGANDIA